MKVALAQIRIEGGKPVSNVASAEEAVARAAAAGSDVVVLPEALDCGWSDPCARTLSEPIPGGTPCERLRAAAAHNRIYVCGGLVERAGDLIYNAAVLFSSEGTLLLHHRKIHEIDIAQPLYAKGDRLAVARTPFGLVGVMICADAFAPQLCVSRTLGLLGAQYILSPCAWAVPADHDQRREPYGQLWRECYGTAAREFALSVVGASNVGAIVRGGWAGRRCIGCSMVVGPSGAVAVEGPYGEDAEALLLVDLD